ncbi:MAG: hypothetical protein EOT05_03210 [Candidatus Microsaccharimonas sossegonensis]|uniref:TrbC/VIRB2 family protein n=1 Tax=Candidatus Microsaccharimonas sossegonensis TaxID=2506948 RepID=A0A4Q0AHS4_9BACT|nr:MAG: hypothetical protein EOT05_03210 [Candidatus Microsaccharimonas sossegonensis]
MFKHARKLGAAIFMAAAFLPLAGAGGTLDQKTAATTLKSIAPSCGWVNTIKQSASSASGSNVSDAVANFLGLMQASAVILVVVAVGLFAVTFFTRHRGKVLTIFAGALGVILFMGAIVGFATSSSTGACSFI